ncbi:MAG: glycerate kinase, partial [bacterium]|nr:glycerate kinase [bacterium]
INFLINKGVNRIYLSVGGSATCDGGVGILTALGFKFVGVEGIPLGKDLVKIKDIEFPENYDNLRKIEFVILADVKNRLLGNYGAAKVFAPQKGADAQAVEILDNGLKNFANIIKKKIGIDVSKIEGSGAAGGVPAGMMLLNSKIVSGAKKIVEILDLENWIKKSNIVITGEGKIDIQTNFGKLPYIIAKIAKKYKKKVIAVCAIKARGYQVKTFDAVFSISDGPRTEGYMIKNAKYLLKDLAYNIGGILLK